MFFIELKKSLFFFSSSLDVAEGHLLWEGNTQNESFIIVFFLLSLSA